MESHDLKLHPLALRIDRSNSIGSSNKDSDYEDSPATECGKTFFFDPSELYRPEHKPVDEYRVYTSDSVSYCLY